MQRVPSAAKLCTGSPSAVCHCGSFVRAAGDGVASPTRSEPTISWTRPQGKVIPYGVYDLGAHADWVSVGVGGNTPEFAVPTLHQW